MWRLMMGSVGAACGEILSSSLLAQWGARTRSFPIVDFGLHICKDEMGWFFRTLVTDRVEKELIIAQDWIAGLGAD